MSIEEQKRIAKAKLYNMKSAIEGLITMVDSDVMEPEAAVMGVTTLAAKAYDDFCEQAKTP